MLETFEVEVLSSAEEDLDIARSFYDSIERGLGSYFLNEMWGEIQSLSTMPGRHAEVLGYHRLITRQFPFAIFYRIVERTVRVYAVLDCRQDPEKLRQRLQ